MTAKEYLEQIKKIDTIINNKLIECEHWKKLAESVSAASDEVRVQSSGSKQKMADAVIKYVDIEREINEHIDHLIEVKKDVINTLEYLPEVEYDVLHKIYVQNKTLYEVADERDVSYPSVASAHGRGLALVENILKRKDYKII
ncbi:MAG: hypothetical protein IKL46_04880 [Clostridia bacterium]|nr:hypothetical protein [Clostridia bacterium]